MTRTKIGILGGTFDPVHFGHLRAAEEAREGLGLEKVIFIPSYCPPHKDPSRLTPFKHRERMLRLALKGVSGLEVSAIEGSLTTPSYTVNTLKALKEGPLRDSIIYFLMGTDAFLSIESWKDFRSILELSRVVVMRRGESGAGSLEVFCERLFPGAMESGNIVFLDITRLEISSSWIREKVRGQGSIRFLLPDPCIDYLEENRLYMNEQLLEKEVQAGEPPVRLFMEELRESHGERIVALDVRGLSSVCDYFVISQGRSTRHVQGISERLRERLGRHGILPREVEGEQEGKWILMDYGAIVVHLFYEPVRGFYDLEGLWHKAKVYELES